MSIRKYFIPDFTWIEVLRSGPKRRFNAGWWKSLFWNSPAHAWMVTFWPSRGTLSILFGVHQFLWHPFTVWRAWRYLYKENPSWFYLVCILVHDLGYWGKPNMDGPQGQTHPEGGAKIAWYIVYWIKRLLGDNTHVACLFADQAHGICLRHSTHYAQAKGLPVSSLYLPDKVSVLFDPPWFYKLRARLSGELAEYLSNANERSMCDWGPFRSADSWINWYRARMTRKAQDFFNK